MLNELFKCPRHLVQQSVERILKQLLKRAFTQEQILLGRFFDAFFCSGVKALKDEQTCCDELSLKCT